MKRPSRHAIYIKDDNDDDDDDDEKLYTSKNKKVVAEVSKGKDKQVIIVVDDHDQDDDLDEDTEIKLGVVIKNVVKIMDRTLKRWHSGKQYHVYAGVDSGEMKLVHEFNQYWQWDEATLRYNSKYDFRFVLTLEPNLGNYFRFVDIEIVQVHHPAAEIGTSNGVMVVGRTQVPIPKRYSENWAHVKEVIKTVGGKCKVNGILEFVIEKRKIKRNKYYDPRSNNYYDPRSGRFYQCLD